MKWTVILCVVAVLGLDSAQAEPNTNVPTPSPAMNGPAKPGTTTASIPPQPGAPFRPTVPPRDPNAITPQEWQRLNAARTAALKANPALMQKGAEISAKMHAFQQKLDAAIIKADPTIAPLLAKLALLRHPPAGAPPNASPSNSNPGAALK